MIRTWMSVGVMVTLLASTSLVRAENEGQQSLNEASEKTLDANNLQDLSDVIALCDKAIKEGLDEGNTKFANSLLCGTLARRGMILTSVILDQERPDPRWPQIRAQALQDLERAVKLNDEQGDAHYLIGRLHTLPGGDRDRARKAAAKAVELTKPDRNAHARSLVLRANLGTDVKERQADYDEAVKLAEDDPEARRSRGLFLLLQGKPAEAVTDLDEAIKLAPKEASAYEARGLALLMQKKYDPALADLDKVIELVPESSLPHMHRGRILAEQKKLPEAIEAFTQSLKRDPDNLSALLLRARAHQLNKDTKAAREDVDAALKNRPGMTAALELRAILAATSGDLDQALADFEDLAQITPNSAELQMQIGILHAADKRPNAAIDRFTAALAIDKENFPALRSRADAYLAVGKHPEAVADYEVALKLKPEDAGVLNNLAWVLSTSPNDKVRDGKRAIELATEACKKTEYKQAHILSTLAAAYAEAGNWDEAVKWSKKAVEMTDAANRKQIEGELASYEAKKPWRELQEEKDAPRKSKDADKSKDDAPASDPTDVAKKVGDTAGTSDPDTADPGPVKDGADKKDEPAKDDPAKDDSEKESTEKEKTEPVKESDEGEPAKDPTAGEDK
ncbi:MAG: tetratricopeptide repeat protein [Planctomycetota bacterium]|nr:tetratricopeptide repeat protein [Planctomycetota bacterium]